MGKSCVFSVDDRIFPLPAILKTSYLYLDCYYLHLEYKSDHIVIIEITGKEKGSLPDTISSSFSNDLIAQVTRHYISEKEKNTRELILGRALYSTCLETEEFIEPPVTPAPQFSLDDIAVSWKGDSIE